MEVAFVNRPEGERVPERGILAAPDFPINMLRRLGPAGGLDRPSLLGGMNTGLVVWPGVFLAGPVLGAPMAVMALEELARRGAKEIIFLGSAGCLSGALDIGTIFCPARGISTEGTSPHYPAPLEADAGLRGRIVAAGREAGLVNFEDRPLTIWSTDGIYRETADLIAAQRAAGADAVEMECTALFAAGGFRGVKVAALLVILSFASPSIAGDATRAAYSTAGLPSLLGVPPPEPDRKSIGLASFPRRRTSFCVLANA